MAASTPLVASLPNFLTFEIARMSQVRLGESC